MMIQRLFSTKKELLYGASSVIAALENKRRKMYRMIVQSAMEDSDCESELRVQAKRLAGRSSVPIASMTRTQMSRLTEDRPHQVSFC
jgi:tRNA G18 (ribose-2'-O)-methylase SpoU